MRVAGHSMTPVLHPGELVLVSKGAFTSREPRRGEIVMARPSSLSGQAFVKRIVGLPHERVEVDGRSWQLAEGEFFLLGDQAEHSMDSRSFGPVRREELVGPIRARVWPWKRRTRLTGGGGASWGSC
jgi:signal peptidase I